MSLQPQIEEGDFKLEAETCAETSETARNSELNFAAQDKVCSDKMMRICRPLLKADAAKMQTLHNLVVGKQGLKDGVWFP